MSTTPASSIRRAICELVKVASMGGGRGISLTSQPRGSLGAQGKPFEIFAKNMFAECLGALSSHVDVAWEQVLRTEDRFAIEEIELLTHETHWDAMLGSGIKLSTGDSQIVVEAWKHLYSQVAGAQSSLSGEEAGATSASPGGVIEGAVTTVLVNRYERSATARRKCIEHYGAICAVCSLDFKATYGQIGEGFIHVHHVVPISSIGETYILDPIEDLVPVCPNCHAMLHRGTDVPRDVLELQKLMRGR